MFNPEENAWRRGWEGTRTWIGDYWASWLLGFILPGVIAAATGIFYLGSSPLRSTVYGLVAGITGLVLLFLVSLIWHLISGLKQQRDEARTEIINISASLQETIEAVNSSSCKLVDLEDKHKALIETYRPIKELASFKSGDVIKGKKFNVSLMFNQMKTSVISNVTFENCEFIGPVVISLLGKESEISGTSFGRNIENVVVKADTGKGYLGMCTFLNCKIRNCRFENIGILGDDTLKEKLSKQTQER